MKTIFQICGLAAQNLAGWAAADSLDGDQPDQRPDPPVTLSIGGEIVASCARGGKTKQGKKGGTLKGFSIPFVPAMVYTALLDGGRLEQLSISFDGNSQSVEGLEPSVLDFGAFRSLVLCDQVEIRVSDLWFASGNQLRLRLYVDELAPVDPFNCLTLRFYQYDQDRNQTASLIGRFPIERQGTYFISIDLINPYLPLLFTLCGADNTTQAMDILPFPSLCRGGYHFAELQSVSSTGRYINDLQSLSDSLIREYFGWADAPPARSIGRIAVNTAQATGAEEIFSVNLRFWVDHIFGVPIDVDRSATGGLVDQSDEFERRLRGANDAKVDDRLTLHLPANALPTVSSLATRRLRLSSDAAQMCGSFVAADRRNGAPSWLVSMPPMPAWLDELQPRSSIRFYPVVSGNPVPVQGADIQPLEGDIPLSVHFISTASREEVGGAFPTARDVDANILRISSPIGVRKSPLVSVIVSARDGLVDLTNFVSSLATQDLRETVELILVNNRSSSIFIEAASQMLERAFPNRFKIVDYDRPFNHSAQANLGAEHAKGDFLLIANNDIIFLDPRTIETLVTLADNERVASSSCLLLQEKKSVTPVLRFRSAGVFPSELSLFSRPYVSFAEINCEAVLSNATYPVVGNSFALSAVRADNWQKVGGLDASLFPIDYNDVDYGLRALNNGMIHLCTTGVAAFHKGRSTRGGSSDIHASRFLVRMPLDRILNHCTVIRRLDS